MDISNEENRLSAEDKKELLDVMDKHFQIFMRARSFTPYIDPESIINLLSFKLGNCLCVSTPPIYQEYGYTCHIIFELDQFDTGEKYKQYQDIGHWINQSFFIELKNILDTYISDWNQCPLKDDKYFELLRLCRNLFAHSSYQLGYKQRAGYDQDYDQALRLYKKYFGNLIKNQEELNLSITDFVKPFYEKLVELINDLL